MENKKVMLLCTHGYFGKELVKSAEMIIGHMDDIRTFSLLPGMSIEDFKNLVEPTLKELPKDTICLVDLFGGTPSNTMAMLSREYHNHVISGVNLAMLIEMYSQKDSLSTEELIECGLRTLAESGKDVVKVIMTR